jgi:tetratricopeptide (TPR) repeat protein
VAYHLKAKEKLLAAYHVLKNNGDFLFSLGLAYSTINQNDSAIFYLCRSALFKNDYELHRKLGELYFEQNNFTKAEEHFLSAVYMVPNRFRSRELLVDFYSKTGSKTKAVYWAQASLAFPVKVPSERVTQIRNRFAAYLKTGYW